MGCMLARAEWAELAEALLADSGRLPGATDFDLVAKTLFLVPVFLVTPSQNRR